MATIRQKQIAEMIRRHFGTVLQQEGSYIYGTTPFVTVTEVQVTPDFSQARIYLSVFNTENKQEVILQMENSYYRLKQSLAARIGKKIRRMPELKFFLDDTVDEMYRVEQLLNKIGMPSKPVSDEEE
ncbi:MAG: ribosome-binding factor A [Saprospirales bacterium]|jgi:ribosome-binding factor A|nr:ribosome-binding factor A [Saprospirales bacterium]